MALHDPTPLTTLEATVTSKGQVTLPSALRKRFGLEKGSRIRFSIPQSGPVQVEPVCLELEELWTFAAREPKSAGVMSFEEMDVAKAQRRW